MSYFCRYKLLFNEFTHAEALLNPLVLSGIETNIEFWEDYRCHHLDCFNMLNFYPIIALVSIINHRYGLMCILRCQSSTSAASEICLTVRKCSKSLCNTSDMTVSAETKKFSQLSNFFDCVILRRCVKRSGWDRGWERGWTRWMGRERNECLWTVIRPMSIRLDYRIWKGSGQSREKDRFRKEADRRYIVWEKANYAVGIEILIWKSTFTKTKTRYLYILD